MWVCALVASALSCVFEWYVWHVKTSGSSDREKPSDWRGVSCKGEMMGGWEDPRSTQVFPSMWEMLKLNCIKEPDTLIHNTDIRVHVSASTEAIRSTAGMCVSHHWMISVIWASQWATLSFLSASSLSSSSSCRLEPFTFSNMLVSWRDKTHKQQRWRSTGTIALWELDCLKHTNGGRGKLIWS